MMSIILPARLMDDDTPMWKMDNQREAHDYAEKKYPKQYKNRNCRMGFHNKDYWFIVAVIGAYVAALETRQPELLIKK